MTEYTFHDFVRDNYGPFAFDDDLEDFIADREYELSEAFDAWSRDNDDE
ncbi:hypothetical protein [Allorhizobium borbori]|uniref:Uncharacterized protein n=1 Tax=Allorhizobium borbori TaxID=485907 RepID=A0A7W6P166_9HYPH|nr:hypothetical protein [Allorhizobium borbori]MBB4102414.1 hypothetical protein [Allorhizobium borbori]